LTFSVLEQIYPRAVIADLLHQNRAQEQRERKLNHLVMVYLLIAWSVMAQRSLREVCDRLLRSWRLCRQDDCDSTPTSAAFCYRRRLLGVRVFCQLFQRVCRPFAQEQTPGCFAFGLRLMGIDGTKLAVADTAENRACFRHQSGSSSATASPFPHLLAVLLVEIGTHAIVGAIPSLGRGGRESPGQRSLGLDPPGHVGPAGSWLLQRRFRSRRAGAPRPYPGTSGE